MIEGFGSLSNQCHRGLLVFYVTFTIIFVAVIRALSLNVGEAAGNTSITHAGERHGCYRNLIDWEVKLTLNSFENHETILTVDTYRVIRDYDMDITIFNTLPTHSCDSLWNIFSNLWFISNK